MSNTKIIKVHARERAWNYSKAEVARRSCAFRCFGPDCL